MPVPQGLKNTDNQKLLMSWFNVKFAHVHCFVHPAVYNNETIFVQLKADAIRIVGI